MAILDFVRRRPERPFNQDISPQEYNVGVEKPKGSSSPSFDDKEAYKFDEVLVVSDPDLNPGELTFEEGASVSGFQPSSSPLTPKQILPAASAATSVSSVVRCSCKSAFSAVIRR